MALKLCTLVSLNITLVRLTCNVTLVSPDITLVRQNTLMFA